MKECSGFITSGKTLFARVFTGLPSTRAIWFVISMLLYLSPPILGQESPLPASGFDSAAGISGFELRRIDQGVELWIESTTTVRLVGIEMDTPDQMVIQLPRHRPPLYLLEESFEGGPFSDGSITVRETERGPLTKVSFSIAPGYDNTLSVEGNVVLLQLRSSDYRTASSSQMKKLAAEILALKRKLGSSERERRALATRVASGLSENQALQSRFEALEQRRRSIELGLSSALSEFSRLEQVLGERQPDDRVPQTTDARLACVAANEKVALLQSALSDYASSRYDLANKLAQVSSERDSLESQVSRLRGTTSLARESLTSPALQTVHPPPYSASSLVLASTARPTNLRSAPNPAATPIALLATDISVEVLELSEGWVQVSWESQVGWVPRADLHIDD